MFELIDKKIYTIFNGLIVPVIFLTAVTAASLPYKLILN